MFAPLALILVFIVFLCFHLNDLTHSTQHNTEIRLKLIKIEHLSTYLEWGVAGVCRVYGCVALGVEKVIVYICVSV